MGTMTCPDLELPGGAWDSHVHVVDEEKFPLHPLHPYRPKKADLYGLLHFEASLGIEHVCLIAFSIYHTDNSSIIDALGRLNGKGRAVVCIDPDTVTDRELRKLHRLGARGVRLNLKTRESRPRQEELESTLRRHADLVRPLGWAIQLFVALDQVNQIAGIVPTLGVPVIFDHLGSPHPSRGPGRAQPGYAAFIKLLQSGQVWTKLSGAYRFNTLPDLDEYVMEILRLAPNRIVWASDWPHSGGAQANPGGDPNAVQEYRKIDDGAWVQRCKAWCQTVGGAEGEELLQKVFRDNARVLWQYHDD